MPYEPQSVRTEGGWPTKFQTKFATRVGSTRQLFLVMDFALRSFFPGGLPFTFFFTKGGPSSPFFSVLFPIPAFAGEPKALPHVHRSIFNLPQNTLSR